MMELFDAVSTSEWSSSRQDNTTTPEQQEDTECEHSLDESIQYLCGDTRKEPSNILRTILKRSCSGDTHKQGQTYLCQEKQGP